MFTFFVYLFFFFFNDTATTEIYTVYNTLSLHDALPILRARLARYLSPPLFPVILRELESKDRKSTRLNSSHCTPSRMPSSACKKKKSHLCFRAFKSIHDPSHHVQQCDAF